MGTKGKKNVPITARVNAGLFNQKKGITEPVLNVGPAGVYGNNQTRDIPSPSKKRGYVMKASPFKQKAEEGDIKVITQDPDTKKPVTVKGKDKKVYTPPKRTKEGDEAYAKLTPEQRKAQDDKYKKKNTKVVKGKDEEKIVTVKGKKREKPVQTRDAEDTQTARERSNTVRGGKRMNRKEREAQKKIDRLNRKSGAIDPSTIKKDDDGKDIKGSGTKYDRKKQKTARLLNEAKKNKKLAAASGAGAQRQAEQNRSISARKTGTVKSNERNLRESDMSSDTKKKLVDKQLGTNSETVKKPNPNVSGVSKEDLEGTNSKSKKGRFAGKSKMKKKK